MKKTVLDIADLWKSISLNDDRRAFELLFFSLNTRLIKFSIFYVHQKQIAEEIVSDVFVKCWQMRKTLTDINNPEVYLFIAVKNQSLNYTKKYSNIHLVQLDDTAELTFVSSHDPAREMEMKELRLILDKAISTLPEQARIIFKLIKEDGMKYKEVADILNISPRTVQTQIFRAIKKLSVALMSYSSIKSNRS